MIKYLSSGQLVHRLERYPDKIEVRGSIPRLPTTDRWFEDRRSQGSLRIKSSYSIPAYIQNFFRNSNESDPF